MSETQTILLIVAAITAMAVSFGFWIKNHIRKPDAARASNHQSGADGGSSGSPGFFDSCAPGGDSCGGDGGGGGD